MPRMQKFILKACLAITSGLSTQTLAEDGVPFETAKAIGQRVAWTVPLPGGEVRHAEQLGNQLYVLDEQNFLSSLNLQSGRIMWSVQVTGEESTPDFIHTFEMRRGQGLAAKVTPMVLVGLGSELLKFDGTNGAMTKRVSMDRLPDTNPIKLGSTWCSVPTAVWSSGTTQTSRSHGVLLTAVMPWRAMSRLVVICWWPRPEMAGCFACNLGTGPWFRKNYWGQPLVRLPSPATRCTCPPPTAISGATTTSTHRSHGNVCWKGSLLGAPWSRKKTATSPSLARAPCVRRGARDEPGGVLSWISAKADGQILAHDGRTLCFTMLKMTCCVWSAEKMAA